jgi:uncharacterized protein
MIARVSGVDAGGRIWHAYILLWLAIWLALVTRPGAWSIALTHWPMALVMIAGSMVAGSTPMGGGTVSFPALVLGFGHSPAMARDFGLAIQSVGMSSAFLFILVHRVTVERRLLIWTWIGSVAGLVFGTFLFAARLPADWVKLLFATLWITFGIWLATSAPSDVPTPAAPVNARDAPPIGLVAGIVGGAVMSLIGVGPEMIVYAVLVLRFGWQPVAAVPTAVCATGLAAPVGFVLRAMTTGVHPDVFPEWLAAVPIVIFGAPAGAFLATKMPRTLLVRIIGALSVVQFTATVAQVRPSPAEWAGIVSLAIISAAGLWLLASAAHAHGVVESSESHVTEDSTDVAARTI